MPFEAKPVGNTSPIPSIQPPGPNPVGNEVTSTTPLPGAGTSEGLLGGLAPNTTRQATKEATDDAIETNRQSAFHTDRKDASDIRRLSVEGVGKTLKDTVRNFKQ